jgi:hypothetical protein
MDKTNEPGRKSIWDRSTCVRFVRWLFSWRGIRRVLIVLAWTATIIVLFYGEENWRGRRVWNKYRQALEARGEQFDWKAFIPKPVPDEQNSAATPFFEFLFAQKTNEYKWQDNYERAYVLVPSSSKKRDRNRRHFVDLVAWQMALEAVQAGKVKQSERFESDKLDSESRGKAAPAVLQELKLDDAVLAELRNAGRRPYSRYPVFYSLDNPWGIRIPHLTIIKGAVQRLKIEACAALAAGQSEKALDDVKLMLRLTDSIKDEPILISYLVRVACLQIAIQPIWEGLAERRWSDAQLQELHARLRQYSFLTHLKLPLDGERAAGVLTVDLLYQQKYRLSNLFDPPDPPHPSPNYWSLTDIVGRLAPHGWYRQEQLNYCRLFQSQFDGTWDAARKRVFPAQIELHDRELQHEFAGGRLGRTLNSVLHHRLLASLLLPALTKVPIKAAVAQTVSDQAALACALERYRLANDRFPVRLEELTPRFISELPHDVISGQPYKYRRTDDGQFTLYSVGWDEQDDNGEPGSTLFDNKEGDWVWQYPPR